MLLLKKTENRYGLVKKNHQITYRIVIMTDLDSSIRMAKFIGSQDKVKNNKGNEL